MIGITRSTLWALVVLSALAVFAAFALTGLSLDISQSTNEIILLMAGAGLAIYYPFTHNGRIKGIIDFVESLAMFSLISLSGALASYVIAKITTGYHGRELAAFDAMLGYDWIANYNYISQLPGVANFSKFCYLSFFYTPTILILGLVADGHIRRVRAFLCAFAIALGLTLAIFAMFPAESALGYYIGSGRGYQPISGTAQDVAIAHLRSGALSRIDPGHLTGLINFPSFHA